MIVAAVAVVLWLENYLKQWEKILIVVSHARDFLNEVCTDILHFANKTIVRYKGNYDAYETRKYVPWWLCWCVCASVCLCLVVWYGSPK